MIAALISLGGEATRREFRRFLSLTALVGVLQGLALAVLVPLAADLLHAQLRASWTWFGLLAALTSASCALLSVATTRGFRLAMRVIGSMHRQIGQRLVELPIGWFTPHTTGSTSHVAVRGTMFVAQTAMDVLVPLVLSIVTPLTLAVAALCYDWRIGLVLVLAAPAIWLSALLAGRASASAERDVHEAAEEINTRLLEFAEKQTTLRAAGVDRYRPLDEAIAQQRRAGRKALGRSLVGLVLQSLVVQSAFAAVVVVAAQLALAGSIDPVRAFVLIGLSAQFAGPLRVIAELSAPLRIAAEEVRQVHELVQLPGLPQPEHPAQAPAAHDVELRGLVFGYERDTVLDGLSLRVPDRSMTALVGPSGAGKTTITRLIARFWDAWEGAVLIGGADVRDLAPEDLMAQLSLVFQDVYLFDDTLEANIRIGNPDATDEQFRRAVELAAVAEIAERLPLGWDSPVGEGGSALSGGERQRVSIARALLKAAPIVLFDEPTSALDQTTAAAVSSCLRLLAEHATVLVVAHNLSTIANADSIAFLDRGTVVE